MNDDMNDPWNTFEEHDPADTRELAPMPRAGFQPQTDQEREAFKVLLRRTIKGLSEQISASASALTSELDNALHYDAMDAEDIVIDAPAPVGPPWTLQQFFNDEIDLDAELASRFQRMPVMSRIALRDLGKRSDRAVATLSSQDGAAQLIIETDAATRIMQLSFTYGSMLTLRFTLRDLSDVDRTRWLQLMRREQGGLSFLWGPSRWESDYLVCIARRYYVNVYAFSPHQFEAGVRMTPDVLTKLLDWLAGFWREEPRDTPNDPPLLTW